MTMQSTCSSTVIGKNDQVTRVIDLPPIIRMQKVTSAGLFALLIFLIMSFQDSEGAVETSTAATHGMTGGDLSSKKTIYLIRHAESEENRRISALCRTFQTVKKFSLPKSSDVATSTELLNVAAQVDSNVSEIGEKQISHMGEKLREENFVEKSGIELVIHSPLLRARQTSEGMLGCVTASSHDDSIQEKKVSTVSKVIETDLLLEKTLAEWTPMKSSAFRARITSFEEWLRDQPEQTIAIVGHSQFFKAMLGLDYKFGNCEVWKVDFNAAQSPICQSNDITSSESPLRWSNINKVYSCDIESSPRTV